MQILTDSGTPHFSTPQLNMDVSSQQSRNKSPKMQNYKINLYNFLKFVVCFQDFRISFSYMCSEVRFRL